MRIPPTAQVLSGVVSAQIGAALAKQLFAPVGSTRSVALRIFFAAVVPLVIWRPSLRLSRGPLGGHHRGRPGDPGPRHDLRHRDPRPRQRH
jgi:hypothetical protein